MIYPDYKICACCGLALPSSEFWKNNNIKKAPDGLQSYCKKCSYEAFSKWAAEHPMHYSQLIRNWQIKHWQELLDYLFIYKREYRQGLKRKGGGKGSVLNPPLKPLNRKRQRHYAKTKLGLGDR